MVSSTVNINQTQLHRCLRSKMFDLKLPIVKFLSGLGQVFACIQSVLVFLVTSEIASLESSYQTDI